jgi:hypothetical protein
VTLFIAAPNIPTPLRRCHPGCFPSSGQKSVDAFHGSRSSVALIFSVNYAVVQYAQPRQQVPSSAIVVTSSALRAMLPRTGSN